MVKRDVVGAHYGLRDWLAQRLTAVVMGVYTLFMAVTLARIPNLDYAHWGALWEMPTVRYATLLSLLCAYFHAWIGVRNIFMDYIKDTGLRLVFYVIIIGALVCYAAWSVQIMWGVDAVTGPKL